MDVRKYRLTHGLTVRDVVKALKPAFPRYSKAVQCMVENPGSYGVRLVPEAERLLDKRRGDRHKMVYRLSCRVTKGRYVDAVINALICELNRYLSERLVDKVRAAMYQQYPLDKMEKKKRAAFDPRTVTAVMGDMDYELKKYLSDDLRNKIWNALVVQFPVEEMEE